MSHLPPWKGSEMELCGPYTGPWDAPVSSIKWVPNTLGYRSPAAGPPISPMEEHGFSPVNYTQVSSPRRPSPSYIYDDPTMTRPVSPSSSRRSYLLTNLAPSPRSTSSGKAATSATLPPNFCVQLLIVHLRNAFPRTRNPPLFEV